METPYACIATTQTDRTLRYGATAPCLQSRHTPNNREIMVQKLERELALW